MMFPLMSSLVLIASQGLEVQPSESQESSNFETKPGVTSKRSPEGKPSNLPLNSKEPKREREVDGTRAQRAFEHDTVIRSRYHLNGQALEVDTD